jgi:hypothetical protein
MFTPWRWGHTSNAVAVANARTAATELSRRRVERDEVELYLAVRSGRRRATARRAPARRA